jgi:hypothetical protein
MAIYLPAPSAVEGADPTMKVSDIRAYRCTYVQRIVCSRSVCWWHGCLHFPESGVRAGVLG